jgi:hypothetical protein
MITIKKGHPLYSLVKAMNEDEYSEPIIKESETGEIIVYTGLVKKGQKYVPGSSNQLKGK